MSTLIVTLPSEAPDAAALYGYVLTPDGRNANQHSRVPLALLPEVAKAGIEVVAVVPARRLAWHRIQLPKGTLGRGFLKDGSAARLRAVLEGLLEDRLLDEAADLHFALQPQPGTDAPVWVAVCERAWLRAALHVLEQSGRPVGRIVPEFAPDTLPADRVHVTGQADDAHLVFNADGVVADWPASPASVALLNRPDSTALVAEPAVAQLAEQLFKRSATLEQDWQRALQALATTWDLAQFDLVSSGGVRAFKRLTSSVGSFAREPRWRATRVALLALLAVNLVGLNAHAWRERTLIETKRQAMRDVLTKTFPRVQLVLDAPLQMTREVAALQQASGMASRVDLETMLSAFGTVAPDSTPQAIEFVMGEVRLRGLKLKADDVSRMAFKLQAQGYAATQEGDSLMIRQVASR